VNILPTHQCFDDAIAYISERVIRHPHPARLNKILTLVHGIAMASDGSRRLYAHAWVEEHGKCWDAGIVEGQRIWYSVQREEFYAARQIQETTRYTLHQVLAENRRTHTTGPWKPAYQALCGGGQILGSIATDASHAKVDTFDTMKEEP
jgi:hypothetical protein